VVSWFSPIGWGQATRPFAGERWWPLAMSAVATALLLALAAWLHDHRDQGAGVWSDRTPVLRDRKFGTWQLVRHLDSGAVLGWATATAVVGVGYGALATSAADVVGDSDFSAELFAGPSVTDGFLGTAVFMLALLAAAAGVVAAQRPDAEERLRRVDPLLAGPLPRLRWSLQHLGATVLAVLLVLSLAGLSTGTGYALTTGELSDSWSLMTAALAYAPAALVVTGVVTLAHGLSWSTTVLGWLALGWCAVVGMFGALMDLPRAATGVSPFEHVATMPAEQFDGTPWAVLWVVAALMTALGHGLLARRDLR
jgi:ABC-2 type transport system permease protein